MNIIGTPKLYWRLSRPARPEQVARVESRFGVTLPADHRTLLQRSNGARLNVGDLHVHLWSASQIVEYNHRHGFEQTMPGVIGFGWGGSDRYYAFDYRGTSATPRVVSFPAAVFSPLVDCGSSLSACVWMWFYETIDRLFLEFCTRSGLPGVVDVVQRRPHWHTSTGASPTQLALLGARFGFDLPDDYLALLRWSNGVEFDGGKEYVRLFTVEDAVFRNENQRVQDHLPEALLIGDDGGDMGYLFDYSEKPHDPRLVTCDLGGLDPDEIELRGPSFTASVLEWCNMKRAALDGGRARVLRYLASRN
jgi:hypothetical protein